MEVVSLGQYGAIGMQRIKYYNRDSRRPQVGHHTAIYKLLVEIPRPNHSGLNIVNGKDITFMRVGPGKIGCCTVVIWVKPSLHVITEKDLTMVGRDHVMTREDSGWGPSYYIRPSNNDPCLILLSFRKVEKV